MEIAFLGNWSSNLEKGRRNVSLLVENKYVFDFGPHSLESLLEIGAHLSDISAIFISHMHLDHYAGLSEFLWYRAMNEINSDIAIIGPTGIRENTEMLLKLMNTPTSMLDQIRLHTRYVDGIENGNTIKVEKMIVQVFYGDHRIPDYGYRFELNGKTAFYSGDTKYSQNIVIGAKGVDCLIHEMTYLDEDAEKARYQKHSTYSDVMTIFKESGAKCLIPVHLSAKTSRLVEEMSRIDQRVFYPNAKINL